MLRATMMLRTSTALFALTLCLTSSLACDDGDDSTDEAADTNSNGDGDTTEGPSDDVTCEVFCEAFITQCLQTGESMEFETNDLCLEACATWDQAGINCRNEQIGAGMCTEAGNMGTSC